MTKGTASIESDACWKGALRVCCAAAAMFLLSGCGHQAGPKIPDSAQYLIDARKAIGAGDTAKALEALNASIESEPNTWAYLERAKLNAQQGTDQAALDDCRELLKLDPENRDVLWLQGELKKPLQKRFQGQFEVPPSFSK